MTARLSREIELLRQVHEEVEADPEGRWVILRGLSLPTGWSRSQADVLVKVPPGYPTTPPDNFFTDADLRLANGARPGNAPQEETIAGRAWLMFSFHLEQGEWSPHADPEQGHNLISYVDGVTRRLSEAN